VLQKELKKGKTNLSEKKNRKREQPHRKKNSYGLEHGLLGSTHTHVGKKRVEIEIRA
jgi:hypothetical protein